MASIGNARVRRCAAASLVCSLLVLPAVTGCGGESVDVSTDGGTSGAAGRADSALVGTPSAANVATSEKLPVLLDLGADKCVPCKMMAPILDEMRETLAGRLDVRFIDVWKDAAAAREYGVQVIPTQIFLDEDGNELFRHQGFFSREDMLAKWKELGYEFDES